MKLTLTAIAVLLLVSLDGLTAIAAPARGYIDCRWNAGYRLCTCGHQECGRFVVCSGCSGLVPRQYRSVANIVLPGSTQESVGYSWYAAGHGKRMLDPTLEPSLPAEAIPAPEAASK